MRLRDWLLGAGAVLALSCDDMTGEQWVGLLAVAGFVCAILLARHLTLGCIVRPAPVDLPSKRTATTLPPPPIARDIMAKAESMLAMSNQLRADAYQLRAIAQRLEEQGRQP